MRTKGSSSYRRVEMWRLQRLFNGDMVVPVSRKWLEAMGVSMDEDAPAPVMPEVTPNRNQRTNRLSLITRFSS